MTNSAVPNGSNSTATFGEELLDYLVTRHPANISPLVHRTSISARQEILVDWPDWTRKEVTKAFASVGISKPWRHQIEAATLAHENKNVVISTGTASGKSLCYQSVILTELLTNKFSTALYLSPTKALGADQLRALTELLDGHKEFIGLQPARYDGDTPTDQRRWAQEHSRWLFTNPDMIHLTLLADHGRWRHFLRGLRFIVVDECHHYRGIFGSQCAWVLRRLLRAARANGANPVIIAASATTGNPAESVARLISAPVTAVTSDTSPHGARTIALWQPNFLDENTGENDAPLRQSATNEAAQLLAALVQEGARTLCFVRSRRAAETTALAAQRILRETSPHLAERIASYRAGYLADDRRELERGLASGQLVGVITTNALELGIDIAGLDAVIITGFPGTVASFWQQAGRAGRRGAGSLAIFIARDDPLDTYLVTNPQALLAKKIDSVVTNPANPFVMQGQLLCAASEFPLKAEEITNWGAEKLVAQLTTQRLLRQRPAGWYLSATECDPHAEVNLRGGTGAQVLIINEADSQLLGTIDPGRAPSTVHPGAVYLHRGESFLIDQLDLENNLAFAHPHSQLWSTQAREQSSIEILDTVSNHYGISNDPEKSSISWSFVNVAATERVVGYLQRLPSGEILNSLPLTMPENSLHTQAAMFTIEPTILESQGINAAAIPGALHATEHALIGILPLLASCDRWDLGGLSTNFHPQTGLPTVFIYDGLPGGAGFAEYGFSHLTNWVTTTLAAINGCSCLSGCPSCVQSPKCGNGNEPLDKSGAKIVLQLLLT